MVTKGLIIEYKGRALVDTFENKCSENEDKG